MRRLLAALLLAFALCTPAHSQTAWPAPQGASAASGFVAMCLNGSNQAVPCSAVVPLQIAGTFSATLGGFAPAGTFATLTATNASASVALPAGAVVIFQNTGTTAVSCTLGVGSATATVSQNIVQPASWLALTVGSNTFGACIDVTGLASNLVVLSGGAGLPTGAGGGGGSGGGGAITAAANAYAAGAFSAGAGVDGWDLTQGAKADAAYTGSGSASVIAALKGIYAGTTGPIPAGTNLIGKFGIDQTTPGTTNGVQVNAPLPAGTNVIGKASIDQTTPGTTNAIRTIAGATGGGTLSSAIAPATPAGANLKASAGTVFRVFATTVQATPVYIKLYNSATAPTCGTGTPVARFMIPVAATAANGAGNNIDIGDIGAAFGTGIGYCVTGALADADTTAITANNTLVNIVWN